MQSSEDSLDTGSGSPVYQPLHDATQEIRLLTIEKGESSESLRCWLQHSPLDLEVMPRYESISYTWGDTSIRSSIVVDGRTVDVAASSAAAIGRMRRTDEARLVWIDAVCINQDDNAEKSKQVSLMDQIYSLSAGNLIYLGEDDCGLAKGAVVALEEFQIWIDKELAKLAGEDRIVLAGGGLPSGWEDERMPPEDLLLALYPVYGCPWFQRLWVLQEATLASPNTYFWGAATFPLTPLLLAAWLSTKTYGDYVPAGFWNDSDRNLGVIASSRMHRFVPSLGSSPGAEGLSSDVFREVSRWMDTREPRDRIFALLGLYRLRYGLKAIPALLVPHYDKSVADVFRDATRYFLSSVELGQRTMASSLLAKIHHRDVLDMNGHGYASWALKWDRPINSRLDPDEWAVTYAAGVPSAVESHPVAALKIAELGDPSILTIRGFVVSKIEYITGIMQDEDVGDFYHNVSSPCDADSEKNGRPNLSLSTAHAALRITKKALAMCSSKGAYTSRLATSALELDARDGHVGESDGNSPTDNWMLSEVLSAGGDRNAARHFQSARQKGEAFRVLLSQLHDTRTLPVRPLHLPATATDSQLSCSILFESYRTMLRNRRLFKTQSRHVGAGPKLARRGDVVAVFEGDTHPYVLRPAKSQFHLIGACYVHNLMDGEIFNMGIGSTWIELL